MSAQTFPFKPLTQSMIPTGTIAGDLPVFPAALAEKLLTRMEGVNAESMLEMQPDFFKDTSAPSTFKIPRSKPTRAKVENGATKQNGSAKAGASVAPAQSAKEGMPVQGSRMPSMVQTETKSEQEMQMDTNAWPAQHEFINNFINHYSAKIQALLASVSQSEREMICMQLEAAFDGIKGRYNALSTSTGAARGAEEFTRDDYEGISF